MNKVLGGTLNLAVDNFKKNLSIFFWLIGRHLLAYLFEKMIIKYRGIVLLFDVIEKFIIINENYQTYFYGNFH